MREAAVFRSGRDRFSELLREDEKRAPDVARVRNEGVARFAVGNRVDVVEKAQGAVSQINLPHAVEKHQARGIEIRPVIVLQLGDALRHGLFIGKVTPFDGSLDPGEKIPVRLQSAVEVDADLLDYGLELRLALGEHLLFHVTADLMEADAEHGGAHQTEERRNGVGAQPAQRGVQYRFVQSLSLRRRFPAGC